VRKQLVTILLACAALGACGGSSPSPPANGDVLSGGERFGWDQPAGDATELAAFRYALYVDESRSEASDVTCSPTPSAGRFACTCRIPSLSAGAHTLQIAAFVNDGGTVLESSRSAAVRVVQR
jgi:hypothetical protein